MASLEPFKRPFILKAVSVHSLKLIQSLQALYREVRISQACSTWWFKSCLDVTRLHKSDVRWSKVDHVQLEQLRPLGQLIDQLLQKTTGWSAGMDNDSASVHKRP